MIKTFVGLGSNLGDPETQILAALEELNSLPSTRLLAHSRLYGSRPLVPEKKDGMEGADHQASGQPDYINAVAELETGLDPESLLDHLQQIEINHRRQRRAKWAARTLDLDILLYGQQQIRTDRLTVPHPEISRRAFVLLPLAELASDLGVPGQGRIGSLADQCAVSDCWLLHQQAS